MAFIFRLLWASGALTVAAFAATIFVPGSWQAVTMGITILGGISVLGEMVAVVLIAEAPPRRPPALRHPHPVVIEAAQRERQEPVVERSVDVLAGVPAV